jgi:hypothetical protein
MELRGVTDGGRDVRNGRSVAVDGWMAVMIFHGLRASFSVVTDTGCCPSAARLSAVLTWPSHRRRRRQPFFRQRKDSSDWPALACSAIGGKDCPDSHLVYAEVIDDEWRLAVHTTATTMAAWPAGAKPDPTLAARPGAGPADRWPPGGADLAQADLVLW